MYCYKVALAKMLPALGQDYSLSLCCLLFFILQFFHNSFPISAWLSPAAFFVLILSYLPGLHPTYPAA